MTHGKPVNRATTNRSGVKQIARSSRRTSKISNAKAHLYLWVGGPPPLIPGEHEDEYTLVQRLVMEAIKPEDAIEHILTKDLADAIFSYQRLQKLPSYFVENAWWNEARGAVEKVTSPDPLSKQSPKVVADSYIRGMVRECDAVDRVSQKLTQAGVKPQWLAAEAAWSSLDALEGFERLLQTAEQRRDRLLRQLDHWRDRRNGSRRRSAPDLIDLDAEEVSSE